MSVSLRVILKQHTRRHLFCFSWRSHMGRLLSVCRQLYTDQFSSWWH